MPIFIRTFTFNKMKKYFDEQNNSNSDNVVSKSIENMKSVGDMYKKHQSQAPQKPQEYMSKVSQK
jgi:hypothetical protein